MDTVAEEDAAVEAAVENKAEAAMAWAERVAEGPRVSVALAVEEEAAADEAN